MYLVLHYMYMSIIIKINTDVSEVHNTGRYNIMRRNIAHARAALASRARPYPDPSPVSARARRAGLEVGWVHLVRRRAWSRGSGPAGARGWYMELDDPYHIAISNVSGLCLWRRVLVLLPHSRQHTPVVEDLYR